MEAGIFSRNELDLGSSDDLGRKLCLHLQDKEQGMWQGRAAAMAPGFMTALVWLRDYTGLELTASAAREFLGLQKMMSLGDGRTYLLMPPTVSHPINVYLASLPDYKAGQPAKKQKAQTHQQHLYIVGQISSLLT